MDTEEVAQERRERKEEGTERIERGRQIGNCFEHARSQ